MDLFFEIQRKKTHIFCEAKDSATVLELKKIIEGILKVPIGDQLLKKDVEGKHWEKLEDLKSLADCGFSTSNARAQHPAVLALCLKDESGGIEEVSIESLSQPPPLPDVMRSAPEPQAGTSGSAEKSDTIP